MTFRGVAAPSAGHLLRLVRTGQATTRGEIQELTGLSRSTLSQRLDQLTSAGYLRTAGFGESTGGRRPDQLRFNERHGVVLVADLGATHARVAIADLAGRPFVEVSEDIRIADGPVAILDWLTAKFRTLMKRTGQAVDEVRGLGIGIPGPVDFALGATIGPPMMPGWDGFGIADQLRREFGVPVVVDNDANVMALGEQLVGFPDNPSVLLIKVSTGIGAGVVVDGAVYRGIDGGAGDIGHIRMAGHDTPCMCGSSGCLGAVASGGALARKLTDLGIPTPTSRAVLHHIQAGEPTATALAREAGQLAGEVLATVVCVLNPGVLIIAGDLAETHFVTGVREVLYQRALPRATRHLEIVTGQLGDLAAISGAAAMVIDTVYSPASVDAQLASSTKA